MVQKQPFIYFILLFNGVVREYSCSLLIKYIVQLEKDKIIFFVTSFDVIELEEDNVWTEELSVETGRCYKGKALFKE